MSEQPEKEKKEKSESKSAASKSSSKTGAKSVSKGSPKGASKSSAAKSGSGAKKTAKPNAGKAASSEKTTAKRPATAKKSAAEKSSGSTGGFLTLADLRPAKGSVKPRLRVGRGRASGAGKTSNRGHNGEGQRSGQSRKRGFEGGQMPGYRQMPKINGFQVVNPKRWLELNVGDLEQILLPEENELNYELLRTGGLLKRHHDGIRVLGKGDLTRRITVEAHYVTPSAREKIEKAGGAITLLTAANVS